MKESETEEKDYEIEFSSLKELSDEVLEKLEMSTYMYDAGFHGMEINELKMNHIFTDDYYLEEVYFEPIKVSADYKIDGEQTPVFADVKDTLTIVNDAKTYESDELNDYVGVSSVKINHCFSDAKDIKVKDATAAWYFYPICYKVTVGDDVTYELKEYHDTGYCDGIFVFDVKF